MKTKFKVSENEIKRACQLSKALAKNGVEVWFSINQNDISDCKWKVRESPNVFGTMPLRVIEGGIGCLIRDLHEACLNHGIIKRVPHISNRNPVRLAVNGKATWTTSNGG